MAAGGYMAQLITNETDMVTLTDIDDLDSELCNRDLAPTAFAERHWNTWHLMSLWIGMAVCIPTYMLASYMITDGLSWKEALLIIFLGNLIVSIPMVFNGHAGTRYGIPFPVMGRASFGIKGVHIPSILRALVACGWFGVQTWMGGLALFSIFQQLLPIPDGFVSKFACFMLFWLVNMYFVWKGTESIKILETLAAPLLIVVGLGLLGWWVQQGGGLGNVLAQSEKLQQPSVVAQRQASGAVQLQFNTLTDRQGTPKAQAYRIVGTEGWTPIPATAQVLLPSAPETLQLQVQGPNSSGKPYESSVLTVKTAAADAVESPFAKLHKYILWLTAMVGFWATLALNIPDITRYAKDQKSQFSGQFLGLPTTMALYSFIGIAVTCAAILIFPDVLIKEDAPWDPVTLIGKLDSPVVIIFAQFMLIIATLSTNIVANVIAPAMSFTNAFPKLLSFRAGGILAGLIGIALCPWWLTGQISGFLLNYSAVLGPLVAIMLADYYAVRRTRLDLLDLYRKDGQYAYGGSGFNGRAFLAFGFGLAATYSYLLMPSLEILYHASWFTGFLVAYISYRVLMIGRAPAYT
jgi:cytosine/uracil/thiamine/allantoin permease